jgi:hypothetical protein
MEVMQGCPSQAGLERAPTGNEKIEPRFAQARPVVIGVDEGTRALSLFSLLATVYLLYLGIGSGLVGSLLWPASALHASSDFPRP